MATKRRATESAVCGTGTVPTNDAPFPILYSYAYLRARSEDQIQWLLGNPHCEYFLDSGGYTAHTLDLDLDVEDYIEFVRRWKDRFLGFAALDILHDPVGSERNLRRMHDAGLFPVPVHVRGDDESRMDALFEMSPWVALGGLRRPFSQGGIKASKQYLLQKMKWAKGRNVHWFGFTSQSAILGFTPFSVDCASWNIGCRFSALQAYLGNGNWTRPITFPDLALGKYPMTPGLRCALELAVRWEDVGNNDCWHHGTLPFLDGSCGRDARGTPSHRRDLPRFVPHEVTVSSWVRYVRDVRRLTGTRLFIASNPIGVGATFRWIDKTRVKGTDPYVTGPYPDFVQF